jgi:hypothetical protein
MEENSDSDKLTEMYDQLTELSLKGHLSPPKHRCVDLKDYKTALADSMKGFKFGKLIFDFEERKT